MEFICPACSTRLVINGERIQGKRVAFVCKACGASLEVDGRCDPPGISARAKPLRNPRSSSPALAVEVPPPQSTTSMNDVAPSTTPPPPRRRSTPPPLPTRRTPAPLAPSEPRNAAGERQSKPSVPPHAKPARPDELAPIGPSSEPSLPVGMTHVPPVETSVRSSRPDRESDVPLLPPSLLRAAARARRRRVQGWLAATGLLGALLGGYGIGLLTRAPEVAMPPPPVVAVQPTAPLPVIDSGANTADAAESAPTTVISIDELPIANRSRKHKKRKHRAKPSAAPAEPLDKDALVEAMQEAAHDAAACSTQGGPHGPTRIAVTFSPEGRAIGASLEGGPLAGTIEGRCVEEKFRAARVPPFRGGTVTAHKTIRLD